MLNCPHSSILQEAKKMTIIQRPSCRLIQYSENDAATNMATDEAILEAHLKSIVPPTLRIYKFTPPAVSFGYAQNIDEVLCQKIQSKGFNIVRRPTGGRAVLHFGDLTYAFICSAKGAPLSQYALVDDSVALAYKEISQALIVFLESLGMSVEFGSNKANYKDKNDCFLATTIGDLQHKGHKIVGSAQLRRRHAVLQHGSIILDQPLTLMHDLLENENKETRHANLFEITRMEHSIATLEREIVKGFQQTFNCRFLPKDLTSYEQGLIKKLKNKYTQMARAEA